MDLSVGIAIQRLDCRIETLEKDLINYKNTKEILLSTSDKKNPDAVALGRLGGLTGVRARAEKLSAKKRKEIAKEAAKIRWQNVP